MANADRKYDVVVFGASGVTGQYVIEELANFTNDIKWSIAGRNIDKLKSSLTDVGKYISKCVRNFVSIVTMHLLYHQIRILNYFTSYLNFTIYFFFVNSHIQHFIV